MISWLFLKFTWENFVRYFSLVISVSYCWRHQLLTKLILVKLKILYVLVQWSAWFIFWNIILYCKIIINFLELFSATCFLCILETHLTRRNTSIPKSLKKRQRMTFIMTSSNDDRSGICQFFYQDLFRIVSTVYVQNFM